MQRLSGIGVSPGIVSGRAVILIQRGHVLRYHVGEARLPHELERFRIGCARSRQQLLDIRARVAARRPELASLFDAQILMLDDPMLVSRVGDIVREQRVNADWAVQQVFHEFGAVFDDVADPYLRERKGEVSDLSGRIKMNLLQGASTPRDLLRDLDEVIGDHRRRADALARRAGELDEGPRVCHGCRQPDVARGHSRPVARSAGHRRPAQRERHRSTRRGGRD